MEQVNALMSHVASKRPSELRELKRSGIKVVGYPPGGFLPQEIICASGAVPVCLFHGGDPEAVAASAAFIPRYIDTFCRSQIGYWALGEDPYYQLVDLFAAPLTDNNERAIADCFDFYTDIKVFRFGVPHQNSDNSAFEYYLNGLKRLRLRLEELTGNVISDDKLKEAIQLYNSIRGSLRNISTLRKSGQPPLSGREFIMLNHVTHLLEPRYMAHQLEGIYTQLKGEKGASRFPRLLLAASSLAFGDYKLLNLLEEAGAGIVIEEITEGMMPFWDEVSLDGDPLLALAETYFKKRVPPAYFCPSYSRLEYIEKLARDYKVDGAVWYQLMYREAYDIQSFPFARRMKNSGLPVLKLQSDYDAFETGQFRTRINAFVELISAKNN